MNLAEWRASCRRIQPDGRTHRRSKHAWVQQHAPSWRVVRRLERNPKTWIFIWCHLQGNFIISIGRCLEHGAAHPRAPSDCGHLRFRFPAASWNSDDQLELRWPRSCSCMVPGVPLTRELGSRERSGRLFLQLVRLHLLSTLSIVMESRARAGRPFPAGTIFFAQPETPKAEHGMKQACVRETWTFFVHELVFFSLRSINGLHGAVTRLHALDSRSRMQRSAVTASSPPAQASGSVPHQMSDVHTTEKQ